MITIIHFLSKFFSSRYIGFLDDSIHLKGLNIRAWFSTQDEQIIWPIYWRQLQPCSYTHNIHSQHGTRITLHYIFSIKTLGAASVISCEQSSSLNTAALKGHWRELVKALTVGALCTIVLTMTYTVH